MHMHMHTKYSHFYNILQGTFVYFFTFGILHAKYLYINLYYTHTSGGCIHVHANDIFFCSVQSRCSMFTFHVSFFLTSSLFVFLYSATNTTVHFSTLHHSCIPSFHDGSFGLKFGPAPKSHGPHNTDLYT